MRTDVAALGEILIDFTPAGVSKAGMALYERNPGGAPANVAVAASRLGLRSAFIGKAGDDMHGRFLKRVLEAEGVDARALRLDAACPTTLAFVELKENGERDFAFVRKGCADTRLSPEEVDLDLIRSARVLHVGTLSLTDEPARSATFFALRAAKEAGTAVSCDVNWRPALWESRGSFVSAAETLLPYAELLKASEEEAELLAGSADYETAAEKLMRAYRLKAVAVTLGEKGAYLMTQEGGFYAPACPAQAVDATGAGDCFWGAFLYGYLKNGRAGPECVRLGCAAASVCVERRGAIPALPTLAEVSARLEAAK